MPMYTRVTLSILFLCLPWLLPAAVVHSQRNEAGLLLLRLANERIALTVSIQDGKLSGDRLERAAGPAAVLESDAGFALECVWTDWRAPGKPNNAETEMLVRQSDFRYQRHEWRELAGGAAELVVQFGGAEEIPFQLTLTYRLGADDFFLRRRLAVADAERRNGHFLQKFWPLYQRLRTQAEILKEGAFGQPAAIVWAEGGAFFGVETPISQNRVAREAHDLGLRCGYDVGAVIGANPLESEWAVIGLPPDRHVKKWFFTYLDTIRVVPLKPYVLYNSWYDLRSPEYAKKPESVMNEANIFRIIGLLRTNLMEKYKMKLDAFVLDDGWDVYESDWALRPKEFPRGLRPIAEELRKSGTDLGIWFGPTGGYSFRMKRIQWMKEHGYEVVGHDKNNAMLCVAGTKYSDLLRRRTVDFVRQGVGYFKWDGIQFSCSQPDHGHPVGIHSRKAVLDSLAGMCRAVREPNPDVFLNITSGTWLSPWYVRFANQIWMDGYDYGFAEVPSIHQRDASITYRDLVLYEDFKLKGLWFPIANLMTHGIIKGTEESVGGSDDPLDKFTDDVLFYFARGVSMYELYISPTILGDGEWNAIARSAAWARDRFPLLRQTEMVGGDPGRGQAYGYSHFSGKRGILAVRNPVITPTTLKVELAPAQGLDADAASLAVERVYPDRFVLPELYAAGAVVELPLDGFETAVYEVYPAAAAPQPLPTNVVFTAEPQADGVVYRVQRIAGPVGFLRPETVRAVRVDGRETSPLRPDVSAVPPAEIAAQTSLQAGGDEKRRTVEARFTLHPSVTRATLALLLKPGPDSRGQALPSAVVRLNGRPMPCRSEKQEKGWAWFTVELPPGQSASQAAITVEPAAEAGNWSGTAEVWLIGRQSQPGPVIAVQCTEKTDSRPLPPSPWPSGEARRALKLGDTPLQFAAGR